MNLTDAVIGAVIGYVVIKTLESLNNAQMDTMAWVRV